MFYQVVSSRSYTYSGRYIRLCTDLENICAIGYCKESQKRDTIFVKRSFIIHVLLCPGKGSGWRWLELYFMSTWRVEAGRLIYLCIKNKRYKFSILENNMSDTGPLEIPRIPHSEFCIGIRNPCRGNCLHITPIISCHIRKYIIHLN